MTATVVAKTTDDGGEGDSVDPDPDADDALQIVDLVASFLGPVAPLNTEAPSRGSAASDADEVEAALAPPSADEDDGRPADRPHYYSETKTGRDGDGGPRAGSPTDVPPGAPRPTGGGRGDRGGVGVANAGVDRRRRRQRGGRADVVLVFSKDRPWQLLQLLRSMRLGCGHGDGGLNPAKTGTIVITVVVRITSPRYASAYRQVRDEFERPKFNDGGTFGGIAVRFEYECDDDDCATVPVDDTAAAAGEVCDGTFAQILERVVFHRPRTHPFDGARGARKGDRMVGNDDGTTVEDDCGDEKDDDGDVEDRDADDDDEGIIMFLTDDCLLLEPLRGILSVARGCLYPTDGDRSGGVGGTRKTGSEGGNNGGRRDANVLAFLSRLHPGISWCQTRDVPCPRPNDMRYVQVSLEGRGEEGGIFEETSSPSVEQHDGVFVWPYRRVDGGSAGGDWAYPFDLSGGVYRLGDVRSVLNLIRGGASASQFSLTSSSSSSSNPSAVALSTVASSAASAADATFGYSHPNRLEVSGNAALSKLLLLEEEEEEAAAAGMAAASGTSGRGGGGRHDGRRLQGCPRCHLLACPSRPSLVVLAINRVQDAFAAPLACGPRDDAEARGMSVGGCDEVEDRKDRRRYDASSLLDIFDEGGEELDVERYRQTAFNSSHVGCVFLLAREERASPSAPKQVHREKQLGRCYVGDDDSGYRGNPGDGRAPICSSDGEGSDADGTAATLSDGGDGGDDAPPCPPDCRRRHPALSVLLPIHAAPPRAARHAVASIVMQLVEVGADDYDDDDTRGCHRPNDPARRHHGGGDVGNGVVHFEDSTAGWRRPSRSSAAASRCTGCRPAPVNISPLQVVIVDDRCTDGSVDACIDAASKLATRHGIEICLRDLRGCSSCSEDRSVRGRGHRGGGDAYRVTPAPNVGQRPLLLVDVVTSPAPGVGAALNRGLKCCLADLVARMDADDVCAPGRLLSQVNFFLGEEDRSTAVLGTCAVLFHQRLVDGDPSASPTEGDLAVPNGGHMVETKVRKDDDSSSSQWEERRCSLPFARFATTHDEEDEVVAAGGGYIINNPSINPTDAGFMAWSMLFSCRLCHPSVMFRKDAIARLGGYDESVSHHAEDYGLWLRLTSSDCRSVRCLPRVGVWHRKHPGGTSRRNLQSQRGQSDVAAHAWIEEMFFLAEPKSRVGGGAVDGSMSVVPTTTLRCVATLRRPETAETALDLDDAAALLLRLESSFLDRYGGNLTSREVALVGSDCDSRLGELATISVRRFGRRRALQQRTSASAIGGRGAWRLWCARRPDLHLERMSLLCHSC